jgi:hypothetical protein
MEILKEVQTQCTKDNCQSWNVIANLAMQQAVKEAKEDIISELEIFSNNYQVIDGCYVIQKTTLDNFIEKLEYEI